jgi:PAS domain S-box-containing protein
MSAKRIEDDELADSAIIASSNDAIISNDLQGTIISWNRAAERLFGYAEADAIGQSIRMIVPPELYAEEDVVLERIRSGGAITHYETVRLRKGGQRVDVSLTISPIRNTEGALVAASSIARDITLSKRNERDARHFAAIVRSSDDAIISKDRLVERRSRTAVRLHGSGNGRPIDSPHRATRSTVGRR